ncbi:MAG: serpin family protein [Lachnospiraceae bacterium]|nr:serpin family protein [Lachnospiraceae bacterium]
MMKTKVKKYTDGAMLWIVLMLMIASAGCGKETQEEGNAAVVDLMTGITSNGAGQENVDLSLMEESTVAVTDFSVKLFKSSFSDTENTLISPLTVLYALAMTANGAEGESLAQMEEAIGLSREEMNEYLYAYRNQMQEEMEKNNNCTLEFANSIWLKEDENLSVEQDFLQINADYYDADIYRLPFDETAVQAVNDWVSESTDGTIDEILSQMPENAVMYLIGATILDAQWSETYSSHQVRKGVFTKEDGTTCQAEFMYGTEYNSYLEDDNAQGFYKDYAGGYAFAVLLPDEGISLSDYATSLTGDKLHKILTDKVQGLVQVNTAIPKFETVFEREMSDILKGMGMEAVFDGSRADLAGIGTYEGANLVMNQLLHKTYIAVDEQGTKAGAVAEAEDYAIAAEEPEEIEIKTVYLDRSFIYMIIDRETKVPVFIGTVMEVQNNS